MFKFWKKNLYCICVYLNLSPLVLDSIPSHKYFLSLNGCGIQPSSSQLEDADNVGRKGEERGEKNNISLTGVVTATSCSATVAASSHPPASSKPGISNKTEQTESFLVISTLLLTNEVTNMWDICEIYMYVTPPIRIIVRVYSDGPHSDALVS